MHIAAAETYEPCADLCVLSCYYNPHRYRTKLSNYTVFADRLTRSGIPLYTVELAFGDQPFELSTGPRVKQIRGDDVLWQKERLLNHLLTIIPRGFQKIAWIDCDLLFENPCWAREASAMLENKAVVQLFARAIRLPRNVENYAGEGISYASFAARYNADPACLSHAKWTKHGHTGFAWAARREILDAVGLYDACISGSADHLMAHSFCGDWESACVSSVVGTSTPYSRHYEAWSKKAFCAVGASLGSLSGHVLHLWHGELSARLYCERNRELLSMDFDPNSDIILNQKGLWQWGSSKAALHEWAKSYYSWRKEDGG